MMLAAARVMLLSLLRDRGAMLMAFLLPPAIFVIFAAIFAGASGDQLRLHVGIADLARTATTGRLVAALQAEPTLRVTLDEGGDAGRIGAWVRSGSVDVGVVIRRDLDTRLGPAPILIVNDAARAIAGPIVVGQLQRTLAERLPDVAIAQVLADVERLQGITGEQRDWLEDQFRSKFAEVAARGEKATSLAALFDRQEAAETRAAGGVVTYYAGAVAVLFLLFAAVQGAVTLIDERRVGIYDRLLAGPGGLQVVVLGKFLFLTLQGTLQAGLIFLAAWLIYGVAVGSNPGAWLATSLLTAAAAAGLALALSAACTTRQQAQTLSTFLLLVLSAVGGSMVPRFLMPPWLQSLGWLTPNAWAIEAYQAVLTPRTPVSSLLGSWAVLGATALAAVLVALLICRRTPSAASSG